MTASFTSSARSDASFPRPSLNVATFPAKSLHPKAAPRSRCETPLWSSVRIRHLSNSRPSERCASQTRSKIGFVNGMKTQRMDRPNFLWPSEKKERISKSNARPSTDLNATWTCTGVRLAKAASQRVLSAALTRGSTPVGPSPYRLRRRLCNPVPPEITAYTSRYPHDSRLKTHVANS
jgi:hypothetical protein